MLCDAGSEELRIDRDSHLNDSQQADGDVKTRRADLELTTVQLTAKSARTHYHLLQLHQQFLEGVKKCIQLFTRWMYCVE